MHTNPFKTRPAFLAKLPRIVRLFIFHGLMGFVISAVFTVLVLYFNVANIGHLVFAVKGGWLAGLVFFVLNGIVFSGVQTGIVIMSLGNDDDDDDGGGTRRGIEPQTYLQTIPVPSRTGSRLRQR